MDCPLCKLTFSARLSCRGFDGAVNHSVSRRVTSERKEPEGETAALRISRDEEKHSQPTETSQTVWINIKLFVSPPHVSLFGHTPFVNEDAASCWPRCCRKLANGSFLRGNLQPHFARFSKIFFLSVSVCARLQCARRERAENQSMSRGLYCWKGNRLMFHPLPTRKE